MLISRQTDSISYVCLSARTDPIEQKALLCFEVVSPEGEELGSNLLRLGHHVGWPELAPGNVTTSQNGVPHSPPLSRGRQTWRRPPTSRTLLAGGAVTSVTAATCGGIIDPRDPADAAIARGACPARIVTCVQSSSRQNRSYSVAIRPSAKVCPLQCLPRMFTPRPPIVPDRRR